MKTMARKLFACLLAAMLAFNMIPLAVFATENGGNEGGDGTQSSNLIQMSIPDPDAPKIYNLGGADQIGLSDLLDSTGVSEWIAENGYYWNNYYYCDVEVTDEAGNRIFADADFYQGKSYDIILTDLCKIPYQQNATVVLWQYTDHWIKYDGAIHLYQDAVPMDKTYRVLLSELNLTTNDGNAIDANEVKAVSFIDRSSDIPVTAKSVTGEVTYSCYNGVDAADEISRAVSGKDLLLESRGPIAATEAVVLTMTDGSSVRANIPEYTYTATTASFTLQEVYQQLRLTEDHNGLIMGTSDSTNQKVKVQVGANVGTQNYEEKTQISLSNAEYPAYLWLQNIISKKSFFILIEDGGVPADIIYQDDQFIYSMNADGESLTVESLSPEYAGDGNIVIRSVSGEIEGKTYPVTAVADSAFKWDNKIGSVSFENNSEMTVLGNAFQNMSGLKSVQFNGTALVSIGKNHWDRVFGYNRALVSVTGTGYVSFNTMGMFDGCSALETVNIDHIKLLSQNTFMDIKQPLTVEARLIDKINYQAFNRSALSKLYIKEGSPEISDGAIYDNESDLLLQLDSGVSRQYGGAFRLKEGHTLSLKIDNTESVSLCNSAFNRCPVASVEITGPVDTLGGWAFNWCDQLKTVTIGGDVKTLSGHAFNECDMLETVTFGGSVETIEGSAFYNCDSVNSVRINGNTGKFPSWAFDGTPVKHLRIDGDLAGMDWGAMGTSGVSLETLIVMGKTGTISDNAIQSPDMRVAVFKDGINKIEGYAFSNNPFTQDNNLIYVGHAGSSSINGSAFGGSRNSGNVYFNMTYDELYDALGGKAPYSYLYVDEYHYADQDSGEDVYVRDGSKQYGYGTSANDAWDSYYTALYIMYEDMNSREQFVKDCIAAGINDLGLVFYGDLKPGVDGFTMHILPADNATVDIPADMYGTMLDKHSELDNMPATFDYLKAIVFESEANTIRISAGAMKKFPNLSDAVVKNPNAQVIIGTDAFQGTKVNTVCVAEQKVESRAGIVTLAGGIAPIGTSLVMNQSEGNYDEAVREAISNSGLFTDVNPEQIQVRYFDLDLIAPNGEAVHKPARVSVTQDLGVYGVDTIAPKEFAFFHIEIGSAQLVASEFTTDIAKGTMTFMFDANGFSPYAAAYIPGATEASDGIFTYLADGNGHATITGYDTGFSGDELNIPNTTTINGEICTVIGIADSALINPPEEIHSVVFNNMETLIVGSHAMSDLAGVSSISFNGEGNVAFKDGTAFAGSGTESIAVEMLYGFTVSNDEGNIGSVFAGLTGSYVLTVDHVSNIPDEAFKGDTKLTEITVKSLLKNINRFKPTWVRSSRSNFTGCAIGTSAFEGAVNLKRFTAAGEAQGDETNESIAIGNEAFKNCTSLNSLNIGNRINGIGEYALQNTAFTTLKLDTDNAEIGREALAYIPNLKVLELGGVYGVGTRWIGGTGEKATKPECLVFNDDVIPQLRDYDIRGDRLSVLIFKKGGTDILDYAIFTEGALEADALTVYEGAGEGSSNPWIEAEAFPEGQKVRIYLNIDEEEASQTSDLIKNKNITDIGYAKRKAVNELYVDTNLDETECNASRFNSVAKAKEAVGQDQNDAERFRRYFRAAGYDPDKLNFTENTEGSTGYILHIIGGTEEIDNSFAGDPKLIGVEIDLDDQHGITVQDGAFKDCDNLTELKFKNVQGIDIGKNAFENCTKLENPSIRYGYWSDLMIREEAFKGCSEIDSFEVSYRANTTVMANAFANTSLKEINIQQNWKTVGLAKDAFRGITGLSCVRTEGYYSSSPLVIEEGAFAECGEIPAVLLLKSTPTIEANAFSGTVIGTLRIDGGSKNVAKGAFSGGTNYIDGGKLFDTNLAAKTGSFENIMLTGPQQIEADAGVFSNQPSLKYVYLGQESNREGISGEIFAGMPETAEAYVALKRSDFDDNMQPVRNDGVLRFLDNSEGMYIDGTTTNTKRDGTADYPFKTFAEARAAAEATARTRGEKSKEYYYKDAADTFRAIADLAELGISEKSIRFPVPETETDCVVFLVKGTMTVNDTQTWDSPEGAMITLLRHEGFTDKIVQLNGDGNLTLTNVILDGAGENAKAPLIVASGGVLNLADGAQLVNNYRTEFSSYPNYAGAVYSNGTVNMTGGTIANNTGLYGGGLQIIGSGGVFNMSGGIIENNTVDDPYGQRSYGGGVNIGSGATMYLTGGEIRNNRALGGYNRLGADGGGISVGADVSGMCQQAKLYMTGGVISGNLAEHDGGGVYIQDNCEGHFTGGIIENNTAQYGVFGGGGIYVNGKRDVKDGIAYLQNVLITGNAATEEGGGLAGCSTSTSTVYAINGGAIYGNQAEDGSDIYTDTIIRTGSFLSVRMSGMVSPYMFNGAPCNWTDARTGEKLTAAQLSNILNVLHESRVTLKANPDGTQPTTAPMIIRNNVSLTKGGGIGSNGSVVIGGTPEPREIEWTPEASKILWNRDMEEGEAFTFDVTEEITSQGMNFWWTRYTDKPAGTGTVTGGKDGQATAIDFSTIDLGEVTAADIGTTRTFLVVENNPEDDAITTPETYLAFVVAVCATWDEEEDKEVLSADLLRIEKGKILADGSFAFENESNGTVFENATATNNFGRIRTKVSNADNVFHNYFGKTIVSADKKWLNYDGTDTPPENTRVVFELYADGEPTGKTIELDGVADSNGEEMSWTATWNNLDAYRLNADGAQYKENEEDEDYVRIEYSVEETEVILPAGSYAAYEQAEMTIDEDSEAGIVILNRQTTGELKVSKTVISDEEEHHQMLFSFTVTLSDQNVNGTYGDMTFVDGVAEFRLKDGDSATATGLPVGIGYKTEETPVSAFETMMTGEAGIISEELSTAEFTNTYTPETTPTPTPVVTPTPTPVVTPTPTPVITPTPTPAPETAMKTLRAVKIWEDAGNQDGARPESVTVRLLADGREILSAVLNDDNEWIAVAENLPVTDAGTEIVYEWIEDPPIGYAVSTAVNGETTTITNTKMMSLTVRKEWNDDNNARGLRPQSITVTLMANGTGIRTVTLTAADGWSATIENLPVSYGGEAIAYTWTEAAVPDYALESITTVDGVTVFRNRVTRVPEDHRRPRVPTQGWHEIPDYDTALGLGILINHVGDCFD